MLHSTSLPSISSRPSEILFTWLAASSITPLNSLNLPIIPSPSDSPISSCVVSPRLMIEPTRVSSLSPLPPEPDLPPSPPSESPVPIASRTSLTAVSIEPNSPITVPSPSASGSPITSLAVSPIDSIAPVRELPPPPDSPLPSEPLPPTPPCLLPLEPDAPPEPEPSEDSPLPPLIAAVTESIAVLRFVNWAIIPSSKEISLSACIAPEIPFTAPSPSTPTPRRLDTSRSLS